MSEYKLSIIITHNSNGDLNATLDSIDSGLNNKIQVIVVYTDGDEREIIKSYNNIDVETVNSISIGLTDVYDSVKGIISGKFVSFISTDITYKKNIINNVLSRLASTENNAVCIRPVYLDPTGEYVEYPIIPQNSGEYNVIDDCKNMNFFLPAYFIRRECFKCVKFNDTSITEKDKDFLIRFILQYKVIEYYSEYSLIYRAAVENDFSTSLIQYHKEWYQEDLRNFLLPLVENVKQYSHSEKIFIKACVVYLLFSRYNCNFNDRNKKIIEGEELTFFADDSAKILSFIDDYIIFQKKKIGSYNIIRSIKFYFLKEKYKYLGIEYDFKEDGNNFYIEPKKGSKKLIGKIVNFSKITNEQVEIMAMNYVNGKLEIDAKAAMADYFNHEDINIRVYSNDTIIDTTKVECYPLIKCFGVTFMKRFQMHVSIPVDTSKNIQTIGFYIHVNGEDYSLKLQLLSAASRLNNRFRKSYWHFDKYIMTQDKSRNLIISRASKGAAIKSEIMLQANMLASGIKQKLLATTLKYMFTRTGYFFSKPFKKNAHIWVSFDKLYKGGDNGEYIYHYLKENCKDITPYYIINKDAPDYKRLKKEGANLLITNTRKCRIICMLSEVILATHSTIWTYCGFNGNERSFAKDLFNAKLVCIQHGLTVQKIAQYQNRLFDNTEFYCCASKYEVENILQPIYGYEKKDVVLTGLARYDGLKNNDQKQILITPTWRRDIVNNSIAFIKKTHNNHFKDSMYFKVYNDLINDKKLIDCAKKNGYRIIYLLHPAMSSQAEDFTRNDYVEIMEAAGDMSYEKILTESSLMVTDYSGVQFDFAYMRKPIVYYHPDVLPPFYEEGIYQYDKNGFGEICKNHNSLIDTLCEYMDNQCQCKAFYIDRANDFFAFDDYNSCERIYKEVKKYLTRFN